MRVDTNELDSEDMLQMPTVNRFNLIQALNEFHEAFHAPSSVIRLGVNLIQQERGNGRWWLTYHQFFYIHNGTLRAHGFNAVTGTTNTPSGL